MVGVNFCSYWMCSIVKSLNKEFLKNMSHHLNLVQYPVDLRIDSILPGVKDQFENWAHSEMRANFLQLNNRVDG